MTKSNHHYINKQEVIKSINAYLLDKIPIEEMHRWSICNAMDLLNGNRFDVIVKYIYALHHDLGVATNWASQMYAQHLQAFGGFIEGDYSGKNSLKAYEDCFNNLLDEIGKKKFDPQKSLVPIDKNSVIIDGAHRLAACLYHNKPIHCVSFNCTANVYDYEYFLSRNFNEIFADNVALQYCKINSEAFIAVLFPIATGRDKEVIASIQKTGKIFYIKDVSFSDLGRQNLIQQLYRNEEWLGENGEITQGLIHHVKNRFSGNKSVKFIVFSIKNKKAVVEIKKSIRDIFKKGNDSIHINDTHEETIRIAEQIFNENSVHFLNHGDPWKCKKFGTLFKEYKRLISTHDKDSYCIDTGGVLAAYGLRDTDDIDYLHLKEPLTSEPGSDINSHNDDSVFHSGKLDDLIFDPNNFFHYDGCKFLTLQKVKEMKIKRNEPKDIKDTALIDTITDGVSKFYLLKVKTYYQARVIKIYFKEFRLWKLKYLLPKSLHSIAYKLYNIPFYIKETFGPQSRTIIYKKFTLYYYRGTSLIHRIIRGKIYEPALTIQILKSLSSCKNPIFVDVCANIGLISLNILASIPKTIIFAFVPDPHQFEMFSKTISANTLTEQITLYNEALSYEKGFAEFSVSTKHSSGNGFIDNRRDSGSKAIKVKCNTLDNWWIAEDKINVDAIKIDSEGAELWTLKGGKQLINECRPTIFFKFNKLNNDSYPYDEYDILSFFDKKNYLIKTISGEQVTRTNIKQITESNDDFIALPK